MNRYPSGLRSRAATSVFMGSNPIRSSKWWISSNGRTPDCGSGSLGSTPSIHPICGSDATGRRIWLKIKVLWVRIPPTALYIPVVSMVSMTVSKTAGLGSSPSWGAIWRGSLVGQSNRFIPDRSWVQVSLSLLPYADSEALRSDMMLNGETVSADRLSRLTRKTNHYYRPIAQLGWAFALQAKGRRFEPY